jgi:hypothetical protein
VKLRKDYAGMRFGKLTVERIVGKYYGKTLWRCRCDCGKSVDVPSNRLNTKRFRSCGCAVKEILTTHGGTRTPLYRVWAAAKDRCFCQSNKQYRDYGGRGIGMCDEWRNDFAAFRRDMGPRPVGTSIERVNNDGDYEPSNCVWASREVQCRNKRNNIWLEIDGVSAIASDWSRLAGVSKATLLDRLKGGWDAKRAVFTPVRKRVAA